MNLREGTRRLALLLGAAGAICGGVASYFELQTVLSQWERHNKFEQLANSDVTQQERKKCQAEPNDWVDIPSDKWAKYAVKSKQTPQIDPKTGERIQSSQSAPMANPVPKGFIPDVPQPANSNHITAWDAQGNPISSQPDQGEIKTIHWTKDFRVESIETEDGQILYLTKGPEVWEYLLIVIYPILGFLIPWGIIRAFLWVGIGFIQTGDQQ